MRSAAKAPTSQFRSTPVSSGSGVVQVSNRIGRFPAATSACRFGSATGTAAGPTVRQRGGRGCRGGGCHAASRLAKTHTEPSIDEAFHGHREALNCA